MRLGSSVGTSARLKIVRSTVRSRPQPLYSLRSLCVDYLLDSSCVLINIKNPIIQNITDPTVRRRSNSNDALEIATENIAKKHDRSHKIKIDWRFENFERIKRWDKWS